LVSDYDEYEDRPSRAEVEASMREFYEWRERKAREAEGEPPLNEFSVDWTRVTMAEVDDFSVAVDAATEEAELQAYLQEHPRILVQTLRGGHGRWLISQKRLGSEYVTDFVIAEKSSIGFEWTAVELESPSAPLFTKAGDPSGTLNHAIRQITDWRNWLSYNRDYAARPKTKDGLGLIDIDPQLPGLIVIGRRSERDTATAERRRALGRELRIEIHTYDWLVAVARAAADAINRTRE
jgi:hypothetical protein